MYTVPVVTSRNHLISIKKSTFNISKSGCSFKAWKKVRRECRKQFFQTIFVRCQLFWHFVELWSDLRKLVRFDNRFPKAWKLCRGVISGGQSRAMPPSRGPLPHLVSYIHTLPSVIFNNIINHSFNYWIDYTNNKRDIRTPARSVDTVSCVL